MKKKLIYIYILLLTAMTLLPTALIPFYGRKTDELSLSERPSLITENGLDRSFGEKYEDYLSGHIGLRGEMLTLWGSVQYRVFRSSVSPKVTVGRDGWLFYTEAAKGAVYSDRTVFRIARTAELMNEYAASRGQAFVFTVAPNKSTVCPDRLPAGIIASESTNLSRLNNLLGDNEFYVDLLSALNDEGLYYKYDSHWNRQGALTAYRQIEKSISAMTDGYAYDEYSSAQYASEEHTGDLGKMLLPAAPLTESEQAPVIEKRYTSERPVTDPLYFRIETFCENNGPSLYVLRDSFANDLILPLSNNHSHVFYSTALPYDLGKACGYDVIIVEAAERNLLNILLGAPADSPLRDGAEGEPVQVGFSLLVEDDRTTVSGSVTSPLEDNAVILVRLSSGSGEQRMVEAFPLLPEQPLDDGGFCAVADGVWDSAEVIISQAP